MTIQTVPTNPAPGASAPLRGSATGEAAPILPAATRSEWIKFRSVRSTPFSLLVAGAATIGFGALIAHGYLHEAGQPGSVGHFDATRASLKGLFIGQLAMGVLGVLAMSSEFATGMARTTFAAVPRRRAVLAAKGLVLAAVSVLFGELLSFTSWGIGQVILSSAHAQASLGQPGVLRAVVWGGLYLAVVALLGLGLATALRHTAGAVTALFGILLLLPELVRALPARWAVDIGNWIPLNLADRLIATTSAGPGAIAPLAAMAACAAWVVAALVAGLVLLSRRDV